MIKLAVSDVDGTLVPESMSGVTDDVVGIIEKIINKGITFAFSSGRTYGELTEMFQTLIDKVYFTCCDGALTVKNGKVLYSRKIEQEDLESFFKHKDSGFSFILHGAFENYGFGELPDEAKRFNCKPVQSVFDVKDKVYKITSYGQIFPYTNSGLRMHWDGIGITQYVNRYCNKGVALSDLQMRLALTKYDTAVFVDSGNDICMVKGAKISYCIENKCEELVNICSERFESGKDALDDFFDLIC